MRPVPVTCRPLKLVSTFCLLISILAAGAASAGEHKEEKHAAKPAGRRLLWVTDFHFNPMADPSLVAELEAAPPSQWEPILRRSKLTAFAQYREDPNWWLLQSSLDAMRQTIPHPDFIMITGDMLAHNFPDQYQAATHDKDRDHYRAFVGKTVQFLALQLRQRFRDTPMYLSIGNNDENCGNYSIRPSGLFLSDTVDLARSLAHGDEAFATDWKALGSYNIPHPTLPHVRIINLNTVFFSDRYQAASFRDGCSSIPSDGGKQLLSWLDANLAKAHQAHEKVWLMFHIPPGIDGYTTTHQYVSTFVASGGKSPGGNWCARSIAPMWTPSWTVQFESLLDKYAGTVEAGFAGHTHTDDFRLMNAQAFVLVNPAVSPVYGQNPSFRVVNYAEDGSIQDASTYYLTNIKEASSTVKGEWALEYTYSAEWKMKQIDFASLSHLYQQVESDEQVRKEWFKLYNVSAPLPWLAPDVQRGLYCTDKALEVGSYQTCFCNQIGQPAPE